MTNEGYPATPLAKKLGLAPGMRAAAIDPPADCRSLLAPWPEGAELVPDAHAPCDLVHLFVRDRATLAREAKRLRALLGATAVLKLVVRRELRAGGPRR